MDKRFFWSPDQLNWVTINLIEKLTPEAKTITIAANEVRWFVSGLITPGVRWEKNGKFLHFRPAANSPRFWELRKVNDKLKDIKTQKRTVPKQDVRLEAFAYLYNENVYVHKPSRTYLSSHKLNALFDKSTWPHLNGVARRPSNFIRRYNKYMTMAEIVSGVNDGVARRKSGRGIEASAGIQ